MFESNFPVDELSCSYTVLWNSFKRLTKGYSADERAAMFHGTAERVHPLDSCAAEAAEAGRSLFGRGCSRAGRGAGASCRRRPASEVLPEATGDEVARPLERGDGIAARSALVVLAEQRQGVHASVFELRGQHRPVVGRASREITVSVFW